MELRPCNLIQTTVEFQPWPLDLLRVIWGCKLTGPIAFVNSGVNHLFVFRESVAYRNRVNADFWRGRAQKLQENLNHRESQLKLACLEIRKLRSNTIVNSMWKSWKRCCAKSAMRIVCVWESKWHLDSVAWGFLVFTGSYCKIYICQGTDDSFNGKAGRCSVLRWVKREVDEHLQIMGLHTFWNKAELSIECIVDNHMIGECICIVWVLQ